MRRGIVVGLAALALAVSGCAVVPGPSTAPTGPLPSTPAASAQPSTQPGTPGAPSATPPGTGGDCAALVASLTPAERVGQLFVVGVRGDLDAAERAALVDHKMGSAILMGGGFADDTTAAIRALRTERPVMVTVDQEGGKVQRYRGDTFDTIPAAREQAKLPDAELARSWEGWGRQLHNAGIHLTFAPVADVVPAAKVGTNEPVGKLGRGYGSDPAVVSAKVTAVVRGLDAAGVGSSAKHFPGLGEVVGNTDFTSGVVDDVTRRDSASLQPFRAAIEAGVDTVMVATATYPRIDRGNPAAFSSEVLGVLRNDLGFRGVIASDDLGAAKAVAGVTPRERALRFIRAGGDWVVVVEPKVAASMAQAVVDAAASDPALARRVDESATRVLELKQRRGVGTCVTR